MNVPTDIAKQVVESLRATPFLLALMVINLAMLASVIFTLHEVSKAVARRDVILERCIK